jgi:hypothetical protein
MRDGQRILSDPVVRHQEPARQAHVQPGLHIADRGVRCLHAKRLHELQQRVAKGRAGSGRLAQFRRRYAPALSGRLNVGRMGRAVIAEHDRQTRHALATNQSDFGLLAVGLNGDDGGEAAFGEINGLDSPVGSFERFS